MIGSLCLGSGCVQDVVAASSAGTYVVQIDTGSDLLIVPCSGCKRCGSTVPGYDAATSTTSSRVLCAADADCGASAGTACRSGACHFSVAFEDGGAAYGSLMSDTLWSSGSAAASGGDATRVTFGCAHGMTGSMRSAAADGVWGVDFAGLRRIAPTPSALPVQPRPSNSAERDTGALAKRPLLAQIGADIAAGLALAQTLMSGIGAPTSATDPASALLFSSRVCISSSGGGLLTLGVGVANNLAAALRAPSSGGVGARVLTIDVAALRVALPDALHLLPLPATIRGTAQHGAWRADAPPPPLGSALLTPHEALAVPLLAAAAATAAAAPAAAAAAALYEGGERAKHSVALPPFDVALDTGSSFSYMSDGAFRGLRAAFEAACAASKCGGVADESYDAAMCWHVTPTREGAAVAASAAPPKSGRFVLALSAAALERFPTLRITLAGAVAGDSVGLNILPSTYLHRISTGAVCAGFFRTTDRRRRRRRRRRLDDAGDEEQAPAATAALGLSALRGSTLLLDGAHDGVGVVPAAAAACGDGA